MTIKIENLKFHYKVREINNDSLFSNLFRRSEKELVIFDNFSVDFFNDNHITGLLGKNGSGKTTLIKIITGVITPQQGQINVLGFLPQRKETQFYRNIGVMFGNRTILWDELSLNENISLYSSIYKKKYMRDKIDFWLSLLKIETIASRPTKTYSLGQSIKANLLIHLLNEPKLLILDEPTIGMDIESQQLLRNTLKKYCAENKRYIMITSHNMSDIVDVCEKIMFLESNLCWEVKFDTMSSRERNIRYLEGFFYDSKAGNN